jgi:hypothetical protein
VKAIVTHVINGTTLVFEVAGEYIQSQQFADGSAILTIKDRQNGNRLRVIHVTHTEIIDVHY